MEFHTKTEKRNFQFQLIEGALYLSTRSLLSPETMFPALIQRLGGNDVAVGAIPVIVYLAFFLPQIVGANLFSYVPYRKVVVIRGGFVQRVHIFLLALCVGVLGGTYPSVALALILLLYASNQASSGLITPAWGEFVAKTVSPKNRGKLLGLRTSLGAGLGFLNGFFIVVVLGYVQFPWNYAFIFFLAGILQMSSLVAQQKVVEDSPSRSKKPISSKRLYVTVRRILRIDKPFRQFLIASAFLVVSFMSVAFFTVSALKKFSLDESYVGVFTILTISAQIVSAITLGWLADRRGSKYGLLICGGALVGATTLALVAQSVVYYYAVFFLIGITIGAESFLRYNIAVEYAPTEDRALYVGVMNAWFAPFYLSNLLGGWLSSQYGYSVVFAVSVVMGTLGLLLLYKIPQRKENK